MLFIFSLQIACCSLSEFTSSLEPHLCHFRSLLYLCWNCPSLQLQRRIDIIQQFRTFLSFLTMLFYFLTHCLIFKDICHVSDESSVFCFISWIFLYKSLFVWLLIYHIVCPIIISLLKFVHSFIYTRSLSRSWTPFLFPSWVKYVM